jgi:thioredoxin 1
MALKQSYARSEPTRAEIDALQEPCLLEFGTPWCEHCLAAQPLITEAFAAYPTFLHVKVEDGPGRALGRSFRVKLWPTLIFLKHGKEVQRLVRPGDSRAIEQALALCA